MKDHASRDAPSRPEAHPFGKLAVLGAGSWGTALAATLAEAGREVRLWGRDAAVMGAIADRRENDRHLPGIALPPRLNAVSTLKEALHDADAALIVVPSTALRSVARQLARHAPTGMPVAVCAKGIEAETGLLMTQVAEDELGARPVGVISGPTFAREVALGHPTAATVAFPFTFADRLAHRDALSDLLDARFRRRTTADWIERLAGSVPAAPVAHMGEALDSAFARERGAVVEAEAGTGARLRLVGSPFELGEDARDPRPVPAGPGLGRDTDDLLADAGYAPEQIRALRDRGVVA